MHVDILCVAVMCRCYLTSTAHIVMCRCYLTFSAHIHHNFLTGKAEIENHIDETLALQKDMASDVCRLLLLILSNFNIFLFFLPF